MSPDRPASAEPSAGASPFPTSGPNATAPSPASPAPATPDAATRPPAVESVAQGAHATVDRLADQAAHQTRHLQASVSHAAERLQQRADEWRAAGDEWAECLRATVRENPLGAIATALAIGIMVARLSR